MMRYATAIDRLYDLKRHAMEPGLERTEALLAALDRPERTYPSVQIAGTNGKGATASTLASILAHAGYRVGLYTSPHLETLRERIRVDGRPISRSGVARFVEAVGDELDGAGAEGEIPTFFEATTAMALWYFADQAVDVAVLEVGLGGRHDATSVVDPVAAAVTSVGLDHTDVLGDTIEAIAADKVSVARGDIPLSTAATGQARAAVLAERADATVVGTGGDADVQVVAGEIDDHFEAAVTVEGPDWTVETATPLLGERQAVNAGLAATIARATWSIDSDAIADGIRGVSYPGRGEVVERDPLVVLDGAHNEPAAAHLTTILDELAPDDIHLVVGVMADKDLTAIASALPSAVSVTACQPDTPRAAAAETVAEAFDDAEVVRTERSVEAAVETAIAATSPSDLVCVTGSLFTVAEARRRWTRSPAVRRFATTDGVDLALDRADVAPADRAATAADGVHRSVRLRVAHAEAARLREAMATVGGAYATADIAADGELLDAVLFGTLDQLDSATEALRSAGGTSAVIARQLDRALVRDRAPAWGDVPWAGDTTAVMGIVNVTPDSFYDGGETETVDSAVDRAREHVAAGADIVDIGGESTRPGGDPIAVSTERDRVVPVIEAVADLDVLVSVDTQKAAVAAAAVEAGADLVNDVSGLADPAMAPTVADLDVPIVLMHSLTTPVQPDLPVEYDDVVAEVTRELGEAIRHCERAGIDRRDIIVDPGIGFNKSPAESFELIGRLSELHALGCPVLIGHSQKSLFGSIGYDADEREAPTVAASALAAARGADILRVHHVESTVAAIRTAEALTRTD